MIWETRVQSQVESYQRLKEWYLILPCLTLSILRWSNSGNGVAPSPTSWCSSYRKGCLRVKPDLGRQLYFYLFSLDDGSKTTNILIAVFTNLNWISQRQWTRANPFSCTNLHNSSTTHRMCHKVNFSAEDSWFEFRVFLLLNLLPN